ncbi:hypothetical protein [Rhizobium sp. BG4]|uniref:hypothetical protein n=1 Tax=Rhizobium sp. BG4 TaxID=2613770 RepID=UPI001FED82D0|nr:hypothetical protein [Rhizobium sp. BG4]
MAFQLLDAVAGDSRRDALVAPRSGKRTEFDHANEDADVIEIGHSAFYHIISWDSGRDLIDFFESVRGFHGISGEVARWQNRSR